MGPKRKNTKIKNWKDAEKYILSHEGWMFKRQRGSHRIYKNPDLAKGMIVIPEHKEISIGIINQMKKTLHDNHHEPN